MANIDFQNGYIAGLASRGKFIERVVQPIISAQGSFVEIILPAEDQISEVFTKNATIYVETVASVVE